MTMTGGGPHSPFPSSLLKECEKARDILDSFLNPGIANSTNTKILRNAQGLAIFSTFKVGFMGSVRIGSGILVARLDDGSWSAPSAVGTGGLGFGGQVGVEFANFIFVLPDKSSMRAFAQSGTLTLTTNISLAIGPVGRCGEAGIGISSKGFGTMFSMSKTNGFFGGLSLEGGTLVESRAANRKFYQSDVTAAQLLNGGIAPPADAEPLMRFLASEAFYPLRDRVSDLEQPPQSPVDGTVKISTGAENQPPSEVSAQEASRQVPTEEHTEPPSMPSELPAGQPVEPAAESQATQPSTSEGETPAQESLAKEK
ncbi:hypothetical protein BGW36DRAFT_367193 [Talaromyces proteolyticus]|uniref:Ysc84 actin-binding domain-containing protein n=1 Tax=Talaromyces proteolyticus TaxID=1131652 RepID=A0AAD4L182_9EURO|nr:uncharacterized protein BGW36DRAFT_367193 [Talaromyces proteolyticus]KAH8705254.1 hypothetical protein BGW36DRAFT_367193 [Talaromyces proteolyticus]